MTAPDPAVDPATPATEPQAPAAATPATVTPPAKPSLEDSLAGLDDATRSFVLGEVSKARSEAQGLRSRLKEAEPKLSEYDRLVEASKTELQRAQEAATQSAERAAALVARAVNAEVKALAADKFADPSDAAAFLDLGKYAKDDGDVNVEQIATDLTDLLARKPHLGKAPASPTGMRPNPAQGASASPPLGIDAQIEAARAAGDLKGAMRLKAAKGLNTN